MVCSPPDYSIVKINPRRVESCCKGRNLTKCDVVVVKKVDGKRWPRVGGSLRRQCQLAHATRGSVGNYRSRRQVDADEEWSQTNMPGLPVPNEGLRSPPACAITRRCCQGEGGSPDNSSFLTSLGQSCSQPSSGTPRAPSDQITGQLFCRRKLDQRFSL
jgi:hypothetical protein